MLKTRIITGIFLIGFIFWTIFSLPTAGFTLVVGILSLCMMHEWITLMGIKHRLGRILILDLFVLLEFLLYWFLPESHSLFWAAGLFWFGVIPLLCWAQRSKTIPKLNPSLLLFIGYFTLLSFFAGLLQLQALSQGQRLVLMAFVLVWCSDSLAYAVGRLFGKHKLISTVSPGKTWEGFIGATLLTLPLLALYWVFVLHSSLPAWPWFLAMVYLIVMALVGDLFESLIKRMHGVKDSGSVLPGHGGFLDRFDSLMAVAPVLAALSLQGLLV
jgi:phosphatidate cytidylyltransferase